MMREQKRVTGVHSSASVTLMGFRYDATDLFFNKRPFHLEIGLTGVNLGELSNPVTLNSTSVLNVWLQKTAKQE